MLASGAALVAALLLSALAGLHVVWARGFWWPAKSEAALTELVVGVTPGQRMPGPLACLAVAGALTVAALLVALSQAPGPLAGWAGLGTLGAAAVFTLRGVGGYAERWLRPEVRGLPYDRYNRWLYSPLCLALSALLFVAGA